MQCITEVGVWNFCPTKIHDAGMMNEGMRATENFAGALSCELLYQYWLTLFYGESTLVALVYFSLRARTLANIGWKPSHLPPKGVHFNGHLTPSSSDLGTHYQRIIYLQSSFLILGLLMWKAGDATIWSLIPSLPRAVGIWIIRLSREMSAGRDRFSQQ